MLVRFGSQPPIRPVYANPLARSRPIPQKSDLDRQLDVELGGFEEDESGLGRGDPGGLLRALSNRQIQGSSGRQTDRAVYNTGIATGIASSWTSVCNKHVGETSVTFEVESKYCEPSALVLPNVRGTGSDVQSVLYTMQSDVLPGADHNSEAWHHTVRNCSLCADAGLGSANRALYKLRLSDSGKSHFFAQTNTVDATSAGRRRTRATVSPSFSVDVFGKYYCLCSVCVRDILRAPLRVPDVPSPKYEMGDIRLCSR